MTAAADDAGSTAPVLLRQPRDGLPRPVQTPTELAAAAGRLAAGRGPVAVDAERASGYRYYGRAYLVQLRREGTGTVLVDPLGCPHLAPVQAVIGDLEWVLHAASQDLGCLAELGLAPRQLFDTELGGRLAGLERVGLAAMVERLLGVTLEKGHSAADWSRRPLPEEWLIYAALDVEMLIDLRDAVAAELAEQGKLGWAEEEFAAVLALPAPGPRAEPWRRTSGVHRLRTARQLAGLRALWETRDTIARRRDLSPSRVLPDAALVAAVQAAPHTLEELQSLPVWGGRKTRRQAATYLAALTRAALLPDRELPSPASGADGPPPRHRWAERDPVAARRLQRVRAVVADLAAAHRLPAENLVSPELVRRLCWAPPPHPDAGGVAALLRACGARDWQVMLVAGPIGAALGAGPE